MIAVEEKIKQLSTLIKECDDFRPFPSSVLYESRTEEHKKREEELLSLGYRLHAAIDRCTTPDDSYRKDLNDARDRPGIALAESFLPIAKALRVDLRVGWHKQDSELIHAEMFSDLLEIARELHGSGYIDAAAVQAGTALELHFVCLQKSTILRPSAQLFRSLRRHMYGAEPPPGNMGSGFNKRLALSSRLLQLGSLSV